MIAAPLIVTGHAAPGEAADLSAHTIYLVRHGAYDSDPKAGPDGPGISSLGIAQARLIAARLRGIPVRFDSMISSTMTRAIDTAAVIHETLPDVPWDQSPLIRECTPPTWNEALAKKLDPAKAAASAATLNQAFETYFVPAKGAEKHTILVCHGNVIRYFVVKALKVDPKSWLGFAVAHASLTVVRVKPNGDFIVLSVGDVGHLPSNLQSGTVEPDHRLIVPKTNAAIPIGS